MIAAAQATRLPDFEVTASRLPIPANQLPRQVDLLPQASSPAQGLDDAMKALAAFSLFRRGSSVALHPTSQGVSLRAIGPSGASRSAVLFDGLPATDAFGGWMNWNRFGSDELDRTEVQYGGGSGSWGNNALSGVISLVPREPVANEASASFAGGLRDSFRAEAHGAVDARGVLAASAGWGRIVSRAPIAPEQRGPVDREASLEFSRIAAGWSTALGRENVFNIRIRGYDDKRANGTALQRNGRREREVSTGLDGGEASGVSWSARLYAARESFHSTFTSVDARRQVETPASDQYEVPANSGGGSFVFRTRLDRWRIAAGADARLLEGETREAYSYNGTAFTRDRRAGGRQAFAGLFGQTAFTVSERTTLTAGLRLDDWRESDGHRRDVSRDGTVVYRNEAFRNREGVETTPELGFAFKPTTAWRLWTSAQGGFRRPTLNELHRPFRVGNDITEANPSLRTEHIRSLESGVAWQNPEGWRLGLTGFVHELRDAVANVTRYSGPGVYPNFGFIPAGGVGRVRTNLDEVRARGFSIQANAPLGKFSSLSLDWLHSEATVRRASAAPSLVGKRLPQAPRDTLVVAWTAHPTSTVDTRLSLRWSGLQYDDDENRFSLHGAASVDADAAWRFSPHWALFATGRNVLDERIEASRNAAGVVTLGSAPEGWIGIRWTR